jgi:hypothetical protein
MKRIILFFILLSTPAFSEDIYLTKSGSGSGASCGDARSAAWFNSNATGGNTYHLCGTWTASAGGNLLTVPASGSAGNLITILFETGAILEAPYFSASYGAIYASNKNYIAIDGGSNGKIRCTDNGTTKTYKQSSYGIILNGHHLEVKNLTVENIYVNEGFTNAATDVNGDTTRGIDIYGTGPGNSINHNTITMVRCGINYSWEGTGGTDVSIAYNTVKKIAWGILTATNEIGTSISNFHINNNEITDWDAWGWPETYHQDGIIAWENKSSDTQGHLQIHNNYIHGRQDGMASSTGFVFCTYPYSPPGLNEPGIGCDVYNNLLVAETPGYIAAAIAVGGGKEHFIFNNTIIGGSATHGYALYTCNTNTRITAKNNIIAGLWYRGIMGNDIPVHTIVSMDNNLWQGLLNDGQKWGGDVNYPAGFGSFATWQAAGRDLNGYGSNVDPLFVGSGNYQLQSGSPAKDHGTNTITPLSFTTDYLGNTRTGTWDIGAYEYGAGTATLSIPAGVTIGGATVQ